MQRKGILDHSRVSDFVHAGKTREQVEGHTYFTSFYPIFRSICAGDRTWLMINKEITSDIEFNLVDDGTTCASDHYMTPMWVYSMYKEIEAAQARSHVRPRYIPPEMRDLYEYDNTEDSTASETEDVVIVHEFDTANAVIEDEVYQEYFKAVKYVESHHSERVCDVKRILADVKGVVIALGDGAGVTYEARQGEEVFSYDPSSVMVRIAKEKGNLVHHMSTEEFFRDVYPKLRGQGHCFFYPI